MEHFTSKKPNGIRQDFFAHLLISNIAALFKQISDQELKKIKRDQTLKKEYQTNRSYLLGIVAKKLTDILWGKLTETIEWILKKAKRQRSPLRPNRKCERCGAQYRKTFDMNLKTHL